MEITEEKYKQMLVEPGFITEEEFSSALKEGGSKGKSLSDVLVDNGLIKDKQLGRLIATEFNYKFVNLREEAIPKQVINIVPELVAKMQQVIVFDRTREGLKVALADPENFEMAEWLERKTGERVIPYYATPRDIKGALKNYREELEKTFEEIIENQVKIAEEEEIKAEDLPIIKIVDTLIKYAYENRASDIHIEPLGSVAQVRFRIDGILHNVLSLPKDIHALIVTRIKVLAQLRTDEHFAAQDGKFVMNIEDERFDVRVSIVPVTEGENVVLRLLSERARRYNLEGLGFSDEDLAKVEENVKKSYGMVLTTGPTGCGKTTTLYSILKLLNNSEVNICTIEDPVEYDIQGVSQIQVNPKTNLTFAQGLRSIVRQDPDIIMVGEIRDEETADIAVNSAMTGHLVLSTMHANTAATDLIRLIDMGIEPFLVASSVNLIVAQRLVRKICMKCRESYELTRKEAEKMIIPEKALERLFKGKKSVRLYHGRGCKACVFTGYSGRIGIFEVLEMKDNIRSMVMGKANADEIQKQAVENGMATMMDDGVDKALSGITTLEEIIRVTRE
ncbi:MAG: hypothetical protein GF370_04405 [Candidatus Nealsonbacteria bacterium]|nr:hypothetical protein [Candidatus Nealsonbacteria bacterium]